MAKIKVFDGVYEIAGGKIKQVSGTDNPDLVHVMKMMIDNHRPLAYVPVWENEYAKMICSTFSDADVLELAKVPCEPGLIY